MPAKKIPTVLPTITPTMTVDVSQKVLDGTPMRALVFLRASRNLPIRAALQRVGYGAEDYNEGWRLLTESCGFFDDVEAPMKDEAAEAVKELDAWDEGGFRRARAALARLHPEQHDFVFRGGLKPSQGLPAVMGVMTFLDRLDELEKSPERKSTRKADQAAVATLAKRGIDDKERKRLRALVDLIQSSPDLLDGGDKREEKKQAALLKLRAWFEDWSSTARTVITRRDQLISLGLAQRKSNGKIEDVDDEASDDERAPIRPQSAPVPTAAPSNGEIATTN
ncbi:MAG: hypothetical protein HYV09_15610 [Deltaproteobacteria bacterium]|nr:hypothetical protein [Deltaproteobacteria bacterium]